MAKVTFQMLKEAAEQAEFKLALEALEAAADNADDMVNTDRSIDASEWNDAALRSIPFTCEFQDYASVRHFLTYLGLDA